MQLQCEGIDSGNGTFMFGSHHWLDPERCWTVLACSRQILALVSRMVMVGRVNLLEQQAER